MFNVIIYHQQGVLIKELEETKSILTFERGLQRRRPNKVRQRKKTKMEEGGEEVKKDTSEREGKKQEKGHEHKDTEQEKEENTQRKKKGMKKERGKSSKTENEGGTGTKRNLLVNHGPGKGAISPSSLSRTQKIRSGRALSQSVKRSKAQRAHEDQLMAQLQDKDQLLSLQAAELTILRKRIQQLVTEGVSSPHHPERGHQHQQQVIENATPFSSSSHVLPPAGRIVDSQQQQRQQHSSFHSRGPTSTVSRLEYSRSTPFLHHTTS